MHDVSPAPGSGVTAEGVHARPSGTLVDRALEYLQAGPADSSTLAHSVLGLPSASPIIADRIASALLGADPRVHRRTDQHWELVSRHADARSIAECTYAVVDFETTGSSPRRGDRVIEIGIAVLNRGNVDVVMDTLVNPERPIPRAVTGVTRIEPADVRGAPLFADIADQLVNELAGRVFVAHNLRFDWAFAVSETRRATDLLLDGPRLCTVQLSRRLIPGLRSRSLDSVSRYFGIEIENRHRAAPDAYATARVLARLLDLAAEQGVMTLPELEALSRRRKEKRKRKRRRAKPHSMDEI